MEAMQDVDVFREAKRSLNMWAHRDFLEDSDVAEANAEAYAHMRCASATAKKGRANAGADAGVRKQDFFTLCHKISLVRTQEARQIALASGDREVHLITVPISTNAALERDWMSISRGARVLDERTFTAAWRDLVTDDFESITCFETPAYAARSRTLCAKLFDDRSAWSADEELLLL